MAAHETNSVANGALAEGIHGVRTVQSLNRQRVNFDLYDEKAYKNLKTHLTAAKYAQFTVPVVDTLTGISMATVIVVGGQLVLNKSIDVGVMIGDDVLDRIAIREPAFGLVAIGRQCVELEQVRELGDRRHRDRDVSIARRIDAVGRREIGVGTAEVGALGQAAAVVQMRGQHLELEIDQRFQQAGLDMR